jgi:hypothetical protein
VKTHRIFFEIYHAKQAARDATGFHLFARAATVDVQSAQRINERVC